VNTNPREPSFETTIEEARSEVKPNFESEVKKTSIPPMMKKVKIRIYDQR
jgi:hypothetical protein